MYHLFRHGPFDIQGGGGGLGFWSGPRYFFGQNRSKIIFFAGVGLNFDPVEFPPVGSLFNGL